MNTAVINVKIDPKTKKEAQAVAEELGFSLSSLVKGYLRQLVKTKRVEFEITEIPNERTIKIMKQAEKNWKEGNTSPAFKTGKEAVAWLEKQGI